MYLIIFFTCSGGKFARTCICIKSVFHCASVRSVGYRSVWQRLQLMAYNCSPSRTFTGFLVGVSAKTSVLDPHVKAIQKLTAKTKRNKTHLDSFICRIPLP